MPLSPHNRFVFYDADMVFPFPSKYHSKETYSLIFEAKEEALKKLTNTWLTAPTGGAMEFEPALPIVVATMAFYDDAFIMEESFEKRGSYAYSEWVFRIFVRQKHKGISCKNLFEPIYALIPFIFVSQPAPMVTGRQVFGLPKVIGDVAINYPDGFSLNATAADAFSVENPVQFMPRHLVEITGPGKSAGAGTELGNGILTEMVQLEEYLLEQLYNFTYSHQPLTTKQILNLGGIFMNMHHKRFISLRQIRDFQNPSQAVYKGLLEYFADNIEIHSVAPMLGDYTIQFPDRTSTFPLAECLGMEDGQKAIAGYKMDWEFEFQPGLELWNAAKSSRQNTISSNIGWLKDLFP